MTEKITVKPDCTIIELTGVVDSRYFDMSPDDSIEFCGSGMQIVKGVIRRILKIDNPPDMSHVMIEVDTCGQ